MHLRSLVRLALVVAAASVCVLPASAGVAGKPKPTDGTLSVRGGRGVVQISARGSIVGRVGRGQVYVVDRSPYDERVPLVRGGKARSVTALSVRRVGRNIRFRLGGGLYLLRVSGTGINIAAVGLGSVTLDGDERFADTGLYSLNGADFLPVPFERTSLQLAAAEPPPGG